MCHSFFLVCVFLVFSFFTLSPVSADYPPFDNSADYKNGSYGTYPRQTYLSDPSVLGPVANILASADHGLSPSKYVMWAPGGPGLPRAHPMMLEAQTGTVVWQGPALGWETMGPTVQTCNGTQYITFWAGAEIDCLLYTSPSPRDGLLSRMPSSA